MTIWTISARKRIRREHVEIWIQLHQNIEEENGEEIEVAGILIENATTNDAGILSNYLGALSSHHGNGELGHVGNDLHQIRSNWFNAIEKTGIKVEEERYKVRIAGPLVGYE